MNACDGGSEAPIHSVRSGRGRERSTMSRYPVEAKAVGLLQHSRQKIYIFSISWSDRNNILIYRTYERFKDLTKELRKKFPLESGLLNKSERILPILKDAPLLSLGRVTSRFMERLILLEKYSRELLQSDAKISQCEDVIQFFSPNPEDLNPTFPENSMVIMPSENNLKQEEVKEEPRPTHAQLITQPVVSQTYTCMEPYETKDTKGRILRVKKDEQVDVLIKDSSGWWLVENEDKQLTWFPAPFLIELKEEIKRNSMTDGIHYFVSKGYEAQNKDELTVSVGVVVEVVEKSDVGWWHVRYNGRYGYVPSVFLKPYKNPHQKLQGRNVNNEFGSTPNLLEVLNTPGLNVRFNSIPMETCGPDRDRNVKQNLDRRKSLSLNGLISPTQPTVADLLRSRQSSGRGKKGTVMWEPDDQDMDTGGKGDVASDQARKDSGFDEPFSAGNVGLSTSSPCFDNKNMPPRVPPRPTSHEIQKKCTSVTRNAALK